MPKLLRSLQDDIRSANATQTTLDAWLEKVYSPTFGTISRLMAISYMLATKDTIGRPRLTSNHIKQRRLSGIGRQVIRGSTVDNNVGEEK